MRSTATRGENGYFDRCDVPVLGANPFDIEVEHTIHAAQIGGEGEAAGKGPCTLKAEVVCDSMRVRTKQGYYVLRSKGQCELPTQLDAL